MKTICCLFFLILTSCSTATVWDHRIKDFSHFDEDLVDCEVKGGLANYRKNKDRWALEDRCMVSKGYFKVN